MELKDLFPFIIAGLGVLFNIVNRNTRAANVDIETRALLNKVAADLREENKVLRNEVNTLRADQASSTRLILELRSEIATLRRQLELTDEAVRKGSTGQLNPDKLRKE